MDSFGKEERTGLLAEVEIFGEDSCVYYVNLPIDEDYDDKNQAIDVAVRVAERNVEEDLNPQLRADFKSALRKYLPEEHDGPNRDAVKYAIWGAQHIYSEEYSGEKAEQMMDAAQEASGSFGIEDSVEDEAEKEVDELLEDYGLEGGIDLELGD